MDGKRLSHKSGQHLETGQLFNKSVSHSYMFTRQYSVDRLALKEPFRSAYGNRPLSLSRVLLKDKMDPNAMDEFGRTSLHYAAYKGNIEMIDILLDQGGQVKPNPNIQDRDGRTALFKAVEAGYKICVERLLPLTDVNIKDNVGMSILHYSAGVGDVEMLVTILPYKPDIDLTDKKGRTALHLASMYGHYECCELLIEAGAEVNSLDCWQRTPLFAACEIGCSNVVELLLDSKADPTLKDRYGCIALDYAKPPPLLGIKTLFKKALERRRGSLGGNGTLKGNSAVSFAKAAEHGRDTKSRSTRPKSHPIGFRTKARSTSRKGTINHQPGTSSLENRTLAEANKEDTLKRVYINSETDIYSSFEGSRDSVRLPNDNSPNEDHKRPETDGTPAHAAKTETIKDKPSSSAIDESGTEKVTRKPTMKDLIMRAERLRSKSMGNAASPDRTIYQGLRLNRDDVRSSSLPKGPWNFSFRTLNKHRRPSDPNNSARGLTGEFGSQADFERGISTLEAVNEIDSEEQSNSLADDNNLCENFDRFDFENDDLEKSDEWLLRSESSLSYEPNKEMVSTGTQATDTVATATSSQSIFDQRFVQLQKRIDQLNELLFNSREMLRTEMAAKHETLKQIEEFQQKSRKTINRDTKLLELNEKLEAGAQELKTYFEGRIQVKEKEMSDSEREMSDSEKEMSDLEKETNKSGGKSVEDDQHKNASVTILDKEKQSMSFKTQDDGGQQNALNCRYVQKFVTHVLMSYEALLQLILKLEDKNLNLVKGLDDFNVMRQRGKEVESLFRSFLAEIDSKNGLRNEKEMAKTEPNQTKEESKGTEVKSSNENSSDAQSGTLTKTKETESLSQNNSSFNKSERLDETSVEHGNRSESFIVVSKELISTIARENWDLQKAQCRLQDYIAHLRKKLYDRDNNKELSYLSTNCNDNNKSPPSRSRRELGSDHFTASFSNESCSSEEDEWLSVVDDIEMVLTAIENQEQRCIKLQRTGEMTKSEFKLKIDALRDMYDDLIITLSAVKESENITVRNRYDVLNEIREEGGTNSCFLDKNIELAKLLHRNMNPNLYGQYFNNNHPKLIGVSKSLKNRGVEKTSSFETSITFCSRESVDNFIKMQAQRFLHPKNLKKIHRFGRNIDSKNTAGLRCTEERDYNSEFRHNKSCRKFRMNAGDSSVRQACENEKLVARYVNGSDSYKNYDHSCSCARRKCSWSSAMDKHFVSGDRKGNRKEDYKICNICKRKPHEIAEKYGLDRAESTKFGPSLSSKLKRDCHSIEILKNDIKEQYDGIVKLEEQTENLELSVAQLEARRRKHKALKRHHAYSSGCNERKSMALQTRYGDNAFLV